MRFTAMQERFCFNMAMGVLNQRESYLDAGYSPRQLSSTIDECASGLANMPKIVARIDQIRRENRVGQIADYNERQRILSEIARGQLTDYLSGSEVVLTPESPNKRAISEYTVKSSRGKYGNKVNKAIKLHNPVPAIDLLNKMDKVYAEEARNIYAGINIIVTRREGAKELEAIEG